MPITLAPERVPAGFIVRWWPVVSARWSSTATYEQTRAAMAEGLTGFPHLFNAMPQLLSRAPGPVAAALETASAWYGLIVDGVHVDPAVLRLALRGAGRPMLVTDAMPPVGGRRASFTLYGDPRAGGRCLWKDGTSPVLPSTWRARSVPCACSTPLERALSFASAHPADFSWPGCELRPDRIRIPCRPGGVRSACMPMSFGPGLLASDAFRKRESSAGYPRRRREVADPSCWAAVNRHQRPGAFRHCDDRLRQL
jgi:hypothetical protein